jgi:hypothetical protein
VRSAATAVNIQLIGIPASMMTHYIHLSLAGGIMIMNKIPFIMSISRHIRFGTGENQKSKTILAAIKQVKSMYMHEAWFQA